MTPQLQAFLDMIATSEGTVRIGDRGYNCLVGSTLEKPVLFSSYADHPRVKVLLRPGLFSTAAGRYQILARYYDVYRARLSLPDFSPASQDAIAVQMISEQGALPDVEAGRVDEAVAKCANIWASLPGAGYGQHENRIADLRQAFANFRRSRRVNQMLVFLWKARITVYGYLQVVLGVLAATDGIFAPRTLKLIILGNGILTACLGHYNSLKTRQAENVASSSP